MGQDPLEFVRGKAIIGVGTGTTVEKYIDGLQSDAVYVPSSIRTAFLLSRKGLTVSNPMVHDMVDLYMDGADYFDKNGNLIKGNGGALTTEKLICSMAEETLVVVQSRKYKETLDGCLVPVEVIPISLGRFVSILKKSGLKYSIRESNGKIGPVISDLGNCIVDVEYSREFLSSCKSICGVVEHGFFESDGFTIIVEEDST